MDMGVPRRWLRVFAVFWSVLQFALPTATLYADAFEARSSTDRYVAHVEDAATSSCRPVHAEECVLCRFLSNSSAPLARAETIPAAVRASAVPMADVAAGCVLPARGLPASRAPPTV